MNFEFFDFLLFISVVVFVLAYLVVRHINMKKVSRISENIAAVKALNEKYHFCKIYTKKRYIDHQVKSLSKYKNITVDEAMQYHIYNNINGLRGDIENALYNYNLYQQYIEELDNINFDTERSKLADEKIGISTFNRYERKIIKKLSIKDSVYFLMVYLEISYASPKGKNHYRKSIKLFYDELKEYYDSWKLRKEYEESSKYERSLMTKSLRYDVLSRDNYKCCVCGVTAKEGAKLHVDHIVPIAKGGKTVIENLQTLCENCNLGKSDKL